jgi:hypothetical protein
MMEEVDSLGHGLSDAVWRRETIRLGQVMCVDQLPRMTQIEDVFI